MRADDGSVVRLFENLVIRARIHFYSCEGVPKVLFLNEKIIKHFGIADFLVEDQLSHQLRKYIRVS